MWYRESGREARASSAEGFLCDSVPIKTRLVLAFCPLTNTSDFASHIAIHDSYRYLFFFNFILKLYNIVLVLPYIEMNPPQVYMCYPSWTLLPPHTIPLGRPSAPAPGIQYRASNLDWRLVPYMILYIFQCHSPKSSHPLPLPQSPKDCSIHQCLVYCLIYRVIVTIFLNSIYMR